MIDSIIDPTTQCLVSRILEAAVRRLSCEIELILNRAHVLIEVLGADFIHEGVGVGEKKLDVVPVFFFSKS